MASQGERGTESPSPTSTLSSLTPSPVPPCSHSPPRKRARLSSTSPPPPHLTLAEPEQHHQHHQQQPALDDLLAGLDEDDFGLPPSSLTAPQHDEDGDEDDGEAEGDADGSKGAVQRPETGHGAEAGAGAADDSGLGLLAEVEQGKGVETGEGEPPDVDTEPEYEGDDLWLGFDDADVGFDQPTALPSSLLSAVPATRHPEGGPGPSSGAQRELERPPKEKEEPRLLDFGFSGFGGAAAQPGGFVFATRKPLVLSEQALQRARAFLERDDDDLPPKDRESSMPPPPPRTSNPFARPSSRPPSHLSSPASRAGLVPPHLAPTAVAFQTAAGSAVPLPSADAFARAQKSLAGSSSPTQLSIVPLARPPPAFAGFASAGGRKLDMPSEEAIRRAQARLEASSSPPAAAPPTRAASRPPSRPASRSNGKDVFHGSPAPRAGPASFALPPPLGRAAGLEALGSPRVGLAAPDSPTSRRSRGGSEPVAGGEGGESNGRRTPLAAVSVNVDGTLAAETNEKENEDERSSTTLQPSTPDRSPTPPASPSVALAKAASPAVPPAVAAPSPLVAPVPLRPAPLAALASRPPSTTARSSPFRSPLIPHASTPSRGLSAAFTPLRPSSLSTASPAFPASTPNPLLPIPATQRRLNLGMTPRSKPYHLANTRAGTPRAAAISASQGAVGPRTGVKAFKTPFKGGKPPEGLTPVGLKGKVESLVAAERKEKVGGSAKKASPAKVGGRVLDPQREKAKVFDLDAEPGPRFDVLNFGMRPQTHYYEHLEAQRLPLELLDMDSTSGADYAFPCGRSVDDAFTALKNLVASRMPNEKDLVTLPWVKNHWTLVLWKLASYVRSRPDLLSEWWSFERVMEQLRYRYEREINRAERSCIKRIQEHDSPASLPMVLTVSQIRWDEPPEEDDGAAANLGEDAALVIVGLELTDGWYRIRTNFDVTLKNACERGKLVVGSKIAVMGAKLSSMRSEGTDVLQALSRSTLVISGNSTCLVPWHAPLGFRPDPFVSSLDRLASAGGIVPLIDVVVERAFPCGYIDLRRGRGTETWGEEEEVAKAEEWKRGRKKIEAKLADEAEKAGSEEDELVELLQEAAERLEPAGPSSASSEDPDEILDRLESAANKHALIRKLPASHVRACLDLAAERARASRYRAVEDLQKELADKYPPRDVRGFRVVRIRDAQEGSKASTRTALLTVWDAQSFEEGFFKEGRRYLISNTLPKGNWRHGDREISLTTRRDSRWRRV
ncbi:hypothetical protein JCM8097_009523 [Rhodosporidiobolus ruineniae]